MLLVFECQPHDFIHGLLHYQAFAGNERNECIGPLFYVPNQFGIKNKWLAIKVGYSNHGNCFGPAPAPRFSPGNDQALRKSRL